MLSAPTETSTLLGVAGLLITCLLAVYIYGSKKSCFQQVSKCWCCQKSSLASKRKISKELVNAFSYDDELEVSSECDEDVMRHLQQRPHCKYDSKFSNYLCEGGNECRPFDKLIDDNKQDVFNGGVDTRTATGHVRSGRSIQRQQSVCHDETEPSLDHYKHRSKNVLKQQAIYASLALKNNSKTLESLLATKEAKIGSKDLISLAEKGRIGKQTSTEGSISSDAASAEESIILEKKNILRRLKTASSETESKETTEGHKYQMLSNYLDTYESDTQSSNLPDFSPNTTLSEPPNMSAPIKCGRLEASFAYDAPTKRLCVSVIQANEIPYKEQRTGVNQVYVQVILLPHKKQKYKTKSKPIFCSIFNESFTFNRINPEEIMNLGLRFRVYSLGFARKTHLIGESRLLFACMKPQQQETKLWFSLEPLKRNPTDLRSDVSSLARTDSTSSQSLHNTLPELLLGLSYNGTTGRLSVTILKGSQFRSISTRAPDTYVKMSLISSSGQEIARSKTSVCRGQPNPHFKETFIFQVALFQLPDVTLMLFAYNKRSIKRKELMGWISLGYNSSGEEEQSHWNDSRDSRGEQVCRWHVLHESS